MLPPRYLQRRLQRLVISGLNNAALAPAAYASRMVLPLSMQSSLPAGWLAFTGRVSNPLDRYKRFQITLILLFWIYPGAKVLHLKEAPTVARVGTFHTAWARTGRRRSNFFALQDELFNHLVGA
jgi:hypothetical protein